MPEGPSILIIREALIPELKGKTISAASGNAGIEMDMIVGKKIKNVLSWGKHLLISMQGLTIRIHFLMFGTYSIDKQIRQKRSVRLKLEIGKKTVFFYTCAVNLLEGDINDFYDWETDVLNKKWNPAKARKTLKEYPDELACDMLLDQDIFSGVGNIIKNEVLYRIKLHPETKIGNIPPRKLTELVAEASNYTYDFLRWKKQFVLRKNWLAHTKKVCKRCNLPFQKKYCGKTKRRTFFCTNCQILYK